MFSFFVLLIFFLSCLLGPLGLQIAGVIILLYLVVLISKKV